MADISVGVIGAGGMGTRHALNLQRHVRATEALFEYLRSLRAQDLSSVLVTHNLYDAYRICDRFVVMARGQVVFEKTQKETTVEELTEKVSRG